MLLSNYLKRSWILARIWLFLLIIKFSIFISLGIFVYTLNPISDNWWWEYLSLTKGVENAKKVNVFYVSISVFLINAVISIFDFYMGYSVHLKNSLEMKRTYSKKETAILLKMKKHLKFILITILLALFAQLVHGLLWWFLGSCSLMFKAFYYRELGYLDTNKTTVKEGKISYGRNYN